MLLKRALHASTAVPEGPGGYRVLTPPSPLLVLVSLHWLKGVFARGLCGNGCHQRCHSHCDNRRRVAPPVRGFSRGQAAALPPSHFGHDLCAAPLFQESPSRRMLVRQHVTLIMFSAMTSCESTQLHGFWCAPACSGVEGDGKLAPGTFRRPESISADHFSIAIIVVDFMHCFSFAKTFVGAGGSVL